jgi:hypothetical protein
MKYSKVITVNENGKIKRFTLELDDLMNVKYTPIEGWVNEEIVFKIMVRELSNLLPIRKRICPYRFEVRQEKGRFVGIEFAEIVGESYFLKRKHLFNTSEKGNLAPIKNCYIYDIFDYLTDKTDICYKMHGYYYLNKYDYPNYEVGEVVTKDWLKQNGFTFPK